MISYWRRLALDHQEASHGCQLWGEATLRILRVDVDSHGKLSLLEGVFTRICIQNLGEPASTRMEQPDQIKSVGPRKSILHASWWNRFADTPYD